MPPRRRRPTGRQRPRAEGSQRDPLLRITSDREWSSVLKKHWDRVIIVQFCRVRRPRMAASCCVCGDAITLQCCCLLSQAQAGWGANPSQQQFNFWASQRQYRGAQFCLVDADALQVWLSAQRGVFLHALAHPRQKLRDLTLRCAAVPAGAGQGVRRPAAAHVPDLLPRETQACETSWPPGADRPAVLQPQPTRPRAAEPSRAEPSLPLSQSVDSGAAAEVEAVLQSSLERYRLNLAERAGKTLQHPVFRTVLGIGLLAWALRTGALQQVWLRAGPFAGRTSADARGALG
jgi:hypothetical protein